MASMQCYRSCSEACETKHRDNSSLTHKVSDMVVKVFHGNNNQAYPNSYNSQSLCHSQTLPPHHHNHNRNQSLCHGQMTTLQAHHHNNHQLGQYGGPGGLTPTLGTGGYGHHGNHCRNNAWSTEHEQCDESTYEIRKVTTVNKNRSHSHRRNTNKHRDDGNRSCSDDSSGSDSD